MREYIPKSAKTIPDNAEMVFRGVIFDVYQWPQTMFDGSTETFEMLRRPDTVKIIAIKGDKIIIIKQRQPRKDWFYTYPGGRIDPTDRNELAAAKRELREETGMEFQNYKLIDTTQPFSKIDWLVYTFVATDFIKQGTQKLDAGEDIQILELSFQEFRDYVNDPEADYLRFDFPGFDQIKNIQDFVNLPEIHKYQN